MSRIAVIVCFTSVLVLAIGTAPTAISGTGPTGVIPSSILNRYLSARPSLGDVTVVDISAEPERRKLLAATLQGIVNRTSTRLYLVGARSASQDQHWLDYYTTHGLINVVAHDSLDQALTTFAHEASGYVVASYAQPWTINTATTVAAATKGLVVTSDDVAQLQSLGLSETADHVDRWPDAVSAYEAVAATYKNQLAYSGIAIEQPTLNAPRDFYVQQGIMTVFTRPSDPDYERIMNLLAPYPASHPVYGYVADTGDEEVQAIIKLSQQGRFLVPTDTTDNLSFHIAVGSSVPRAVQNQSDEKVAACRSDQVNVVIATSDGDNMVIPEAYLPTSDRWNSPQRGTLPIGWGISPVAAILMPSIWDSYAQNVTAADEIVGLMGLGYSAPSLMPNADAFLIDSNQLNDALGVSTVWSLDLLLGDPTAQGWSAINQANMSTAWKPKGYLLNYLDYGGPKVFQGAGETVLASGSTDYDDGAPALARHIDDLLATPPTQRPLVSFFPVTTWNASYESVVAAIQDYESRGVRFLTPSEAFACIAAAQPPVQSTTTAGATSPTVEVTGLQTTVTTTQPQSTALSPGTSAGLRVAEVARPIHALATYTG